MHNLGTTYWETQTYVTNLTIVIICSILEHSELRNIKITIIEFKPWIFNSYIEYLITLQKI